MTVTTRRRLRNVAALLLAAWLLLLFPRYVIPTFANLFLGLGVELPLPAGTFREYPELALTLLTVGPLLILGLLVLAVVRLSRGCRADAPSRKS